MKVFSKEKFLEERIKAGELENWRTQISLDTWVRLLDGQKVIDGQIRRVYYRR